MTTRVSHTPPSQLATTIITVEELLRGWYTQVRRARDDDQLARAYQALQETVAFTHRIQILALVVSQKWRWPFYTARPKAYRFTNKPIMMSCICVDFEKQMVLRTKRLSELGIREHSLQTLIGHGYQSATLSQFLGQLERVDAAESLMPVLIGDEAGRIISVDGHMIASLEPALDA